MLRSPIVYSHLSILLPRPLYTKLPDDFDGVMMMMMMRMMMRGNDAMIT
jgi:hypothetical protein